MVSSLLSNKILTKQLFKLTNIKKIKKPDYRIPPNKMTNKQCLHFPSYLVDHWRRN